MTKTFDEYFWQYVPDKHGYPVLPQSLSGNASNAASDGSNSSQDKLPSQQPSMMHTASGKFKHVSAFEGKERKENKQMLIAFAVVGVALVAVGVFGPMALQ